MSTLSGNIDLNADAVFGDRKNEVGGFDSSETNACAIVPASVDNEVKVRDHEFYRVENSLGQNSSVNPGCDEISCGSGREGFDKEAGVVFRANDVEAGAKFADGVIRTDKSLDSELNYGVVNELQCGYNCGVTVNDSSGIELKLNKEAQAEETEILCCNADQNAKEDFGDERNGSGEKCQVDGLADQAASTVMGDENKVKASDDKAFMDGPKDLCASGTAEPGYQSLDDILHMEAKDIDFKECLQLEFPAGFEFKLTREAQAEENKIMSYNADQNAKEDFGDEGNGIGQKCHVDGLADQGASTVLDQEFPNSRSDLCQVDPLYLLKQTSLEVCAQPEEIKCQTVDINLTEALPLGNIYNECHGLNLVVDFNSKLVEVDMNMKSVSSEFCVSDLVWGKVRGHPWWPGQIFDPSAASKKAKRYLKKGNYLVAYFGDQTFAWNDASKIKPFHMYFSQMEKQSNLGNFYQAVDCALDEVSRRVEYGLSCPCTPEVFTSLKTQIITNSGIREHSGRRDGGDRFLNAMSFEPKKLVDFVTLLAKSPLVEYDRLDFAIARAQLLAFHHSKGYNVYLKNDMGIIPMDVNEKGQYDYKTDSQGLETDTGYLHKRKHISGGDCMWPRKKHKRLSDLMSQNTSDGDESILLSSTWKQKAYENTSVDNCHKSQNIKLIGFHKMSADEMWWQLRLAATDPTRDGCLTLMVNFFTEFRNFSGPQNSMPLELCKDSYWTDRVIQSIPEEQSLLEEQNEREDLLSVNPTEDGAPTFNPQAAADGKECLVERSKEDTGPAALILEFTNLDSIPSETNLNKIFGRFGPLMESQTELIKKSRSAQVVFKRLSDAESAFSSAGKYSIFGPSLFRYHLKVMHSSSKAPNGAGKRGRKRSSQGGRKL